MNFFHEKSSSEHDTCYELTVSKVVAKRSPGSLLCKSKRIRKSAAPPNSAEGRRRRARTPPIPDLGSVVLSLLVIVSRVENEAAPRPVSPPTVESERR